MKCCMIEWVDSHRLGEWGIVKPECKGLRIKSIGFILEENEEAISIAGNISEDESQWCQIMTIPKCSIIDITYITPKVIETLFKNLDKEGFLK